MDLKRIIAGFLAAFTVMSPAGCGDDDDGDDAGSGKSSAGWEAGLKGVVPAEDDYGFDYEQLSFGSPDELLDAYTSIPFEFYDLVEGDNPAAEMRILKKLALKVEQMIYKPDLRYTIDYLNEINREESGETATEEGVIDAFSEGIMDFLLKLEDYEDEGIYSDKWHFDRSNFREVDMDDVRKAFAEADDKDSLDQMYLDLGVEKAVAYDLWYEDPDDEGYGVSLIQDDLLCICINGRWYLSAANLLMM